ncbi:hypothetical protein BU17DRAFT_84893 [Hysterangium stoloniferum]|nr:hypothetical protein BU17DRAFT_84893 [Hysterangium stoloniferum]
MTWKPKNDVAFVADKQEKEEVPFDDFHPPFALTKATSDSGFDTGTMERLARGYVLGDNDDEDDVNGSESVGTAIPVGDGRDGITFEEKRRISSSFMESSLVKSRISSFTTDVRSSTSLTNLHASSSLSPSPCTTSYARRIPDPTSRSPSHFSLAMRKGQPSPSPLSKNIVQLREGSPDSHLASDERSNGEQDDEDETQSWVLDRVLDQARSRADVRLPHHGHLSVLASLNLYSKQPSPIRSLARRRVNTKSFSPPPSN